MERCAGLLLILEKQSALLREIIVVTEEEIEAFVSADHTRIWSTAARQERLTSLLVSLEKERQALQQELEEKLSLPKNCKLSDLLNAFPFELRGSLAELSQRLQKYALGLLILQSRLYFLIERALAFEETMARLLLKSGLQSDHGADRRSVDLVDQSV